MARTFSEADARAVIVIPALAQYSIRRRESLYERIGEGLGHRLVLVQAGAGGGKTTFLASFAQEQRGSDGIPTAWMTLDRLHRDRVILLRHLVLSLQTVHPQIGKMTLAALSSNREALRQWGYVLDLFCQEADEAEIKPTLVILDQYERVCASSSARDTIDYLARNVPKALSFLLSTRQVPDLPSIPRLKIQGEVWVLTTSDLCFAPEEVKRLVSERLGVPASDEALQSLVSKTGGWPAMIQMAGTLARSSGEQVLFAFSGALPEVYDYLNREIFHQEAPGARSFLMSSALVDHISSDLGRELAQDKEASEAFSRLERGDFFVSTFGVGAERYHCHNPIFRDFLLVKVKESLPTSSIRQLHARLAEFYLKNQDWDNAIHHLVEAAEFDRASELIASLAKSAISANNLETVARWIDAFPLEERDRQPWLLLYRGVVHRVAQEWDAALELYNRAANLFRERGDREGLARTLWYSSQVLAYRRNQRLAIVVAGQALTQLDPSDLTSRGWLLHNMGKCYFELGQTEEGLKCHQQAEELFVSVGDTRGETWQSQATAYALHRLGRLKEAQRHYLRALSLQASSGDINVLCWVQAGLGHVRAMRGEHSDAVSGLKEVIEMARAHHLRPAEAFACYCLAEAYLDLGDYSEAEVCCRQGLTACEAFDDYAPQINMQLVLMEIDLRRGQVDAATRSRLAIEAKIAASNLEIQRLAYVLLEARIALATARYYEAEQRAKEALALANRIGAVYHRAQATYLLAQIHLERGEKSASADLIGELIEMVESEDYAGFLIRNPEVTGELLANAAKYLPSPQPALALLGRLARIKKEVAAPMAWGREPQFLVQAEATGSGALREEYAAVTPQRLGVASEDEAGQITEAEAKDISIEVFLLGPVRVHRGGRPITDRAWRTTKAKELFVYLLTSSDRSASRDELLEVLWPKLSLDSGVSNFHFTLHSLRRALEPELESGSASRFVTLAGRRYHLELPAGTRVDAWEFKAKVAEGSKLLRSKVTDQAIAEFKRAVSLYRDDYLSDLYVDWAEPERSNLLRTYLNVLQQLAWFAYARRDYDQAAHYATTTLNKDNYVEEAHRLLMRVACETGNPALALRQYEQLVSLLKDELGTKPQAATVKLVNSIREGTYHRPPPANEGLSFE